MQMVKSVEDVPMQKLSEEDPLVVLAVVHSSRKFPAHVSLVRAAVHVVKHIVSNTFALGSLRMLLAFEPFSDGAMSIQKFENEIGLINGKVQVQPVLAKAVPMIYVRPNKNPAVVQFIRDFAYVTTFVPVVYIRSDGACALAVSAPTYFVNFSPETSSVAKQYIANEKAEHVTHKIMVSVPLNRYDVGQVYHDTNKRFAIFERIESGKEDEDMLLDMLPNLVFPYVVCKNPVDPEAHVSFPGATLHNTCQLIKGDMSDISHRLCGCPVMKASMYNHNKSKC